MPARAAMPGANRGQNARQSRKPERANRRQCPARTAMPRANRGQPPRQSRKPEHANRGQCPARTAMAGRAHPPYSQFRIPNSEFRIPNYPRRSPRAQTPVPGLNPAGTSITPAHNSPSYDNSPPPCRASADKRPGAAAGEYTALSARTNAFKPNRLRTIEELAGSDLWPVKSCYARRQQAEPARPADSALSETCPAPTYGRAGRVLLRGSKWKPHCGGQSPLAARLQIVL